MLDEFGDLARDHLLDVGTAGKGLAHARGVHVELDRRRFASQHIALEIRRNIKGEGIFSGIQARVDLGQADHRRRVETRRIEGGGNPRGEGRAILVHNRDRRLVQGFRHRRGGDVDRDGEGVGDEGEQHGVAGQTPQFLDPEATDVGESRHVHASCFLSSAMDRPMITGTATSNGQNEACRLANPRPLLKTPRLMVRKWDAG